MSDRIVERFAGHTPGPWVTMPTEADKPYVRIRGTRLGERYKIANALGGDSEFEAREAEANAHLIAAAPTLLALLEEAEAALERLLSGHGDYINELPGETGVSDLALARATLAKLKEPR